MPPERSQLARWFGREWLLVLVVSFAMVLALSQLWLDRASHPQLLVLEAAGAISLAALFGFVYALLRLGQPLYDLGYCWLTRGVDGAMKKTRRLGVGKEWNWRGKEEG